jgi:hypothetical protein
MAGQGTLIAALDYNGIRNLIVSVLGSGSGNTGYGQDTTAPQVAIGERILLDNWLRLRNDLIKARQHQTGVDEQGSLSLPNTSTVITEALRLQYSNYANQINTDRFAVATNQRTVETVATAQRTAAWNGTLNNVVTVTFSSADQARYFFNSGGQFMITSSRSGGSGSSKNNTWTTMLDQSGTIYMDHTTTASSGSSPGSTYGLGFYDLTYSDQVIYWKPAPAGVYAENDYYIYARLAGSGNQIVFTVQYRDDDTGDQTGVGPAEDENVDGTLTNTVQIIRATGSNVSVGAPSVSQTGI